MQIFILGMHRSGTSAIARVLNLMGAYFGTEGISTGANEENEKGFWERRDVRDLNDTILHTEGCDWDAVADFDPSAIAMESLGVYRSSAAKIVHDLDAHRPWFLKEPRFCVLFPLWRPTLEVPVCLHIYRNPLEVAHSLKVRNGMPVPVGLALWEVYNTRALHASQGLPRLVVSYLDLLRNAEAVIASVRARLQSIGGYDLRMPGPREVAGFLAEGLYHQRQGVEALSRDATSSQLDLFHALEDARKIGDVDGLAVPSASDHSLTTIRDYEATRVNVNERVRVANAAWIRRQSPGVTAQLTIKGHELDRALASVAQLSREKEALQDDIRRQTASRDEARRELYLRSMEFVETSERHRDKVAELTTTLASAQQRNESLSGEKEMLEGELRRGLADQEAVRRELGLRSTELKQAHEERETLERELRRGLADREAVRRELGLRSTELRQVREERASEAARLCANVQARASELAAEKNTVEHLKRGVADLLASRRWRFGDAVMSLRYRLLFRAVPPMATDTLAEIIEAENQRKDPVGMEASRQEKDSADPKERTASKSEAAAQSTSVVVTDSNRKTAQPLNNRTRTPIVAVIAWDVGHNPFGRAYLLAEALGPYYQVVLIGFQFARYGDAVWKPLRGARIRPIVVPGTSFPEFQQTLAGLASKIDPDVIIACKARLPSVQLALMVKALRNRCVFVDVDDYELSFFRNRERLRSLSGVSSESLELPFEECWTRYTQELLPFADGLITSNPALQKKFGGVIVPHARDEARFDPRQIDAVATRRWLGLAAQDKVVMFVGTPRPHKGLLEVLAAVRSCGSPHYRFVVVGTPTDNWFAEELKNAGGDCLRLFPDQPFTRLPELLAAADLICLLQDLDKEVTKYQLPAKAVDAAAMGIPVLATPSAPIAPLISAGVVEAVQTESLAERIDFWLRRAPEEVRERQARVSREWFLEHASYRTIAKTLVGRIDEQVDKPRRLPAGARRFLDEQKRRFPVSAAPTTGSGLDIVVFWKQHDTGLYGRRFEMLMVHLARRPEIRRIAIFDRPRSIHALHGDRSLHRTDHRQVIAHQSIVRRWGLLDDGKLSYHMFLYNNHRGVDRALSRYPPESGFLEFVENELDRLSIQPGKAVFWHYPILEQITSLNERFKPKLKVVDVVDDHRTWPGTGADERLRISEHYREVLSDADIVLANCATVQATMSEFAPHITVVPNGCDLDAAPTTIDDDRFDALSQLPGPKLGLVGNLEPKTDTSLLRKVAVRRPNHQLILVGSTHANPDILELDELPNVHFVGVVRYPDVKVWIDSFDVALIPHLDTEQTRSMHPLKALVYAERGVPIVSTRIYNLGEFEPFVRVAANDDGFIEAIDDVIEGRWQLQKSGLREVVQRNAWDRRVAQIMALLNDGYR